MNQQLPLATVPIITGSGMIVADPTLTILSASDPFYAFFSENNAPRPKNLIELMPFGLARRLCHLLASATPQYQCDETLIKNNFYIHIHISAARMDSIYSEKGYPLYHFVVMDMTELMEMRRLTVLEKKKYDIIADLTEDIPFEYDFISDTMRYADKYQTLFGHPSEIHHFRERLTKGESIDTVNDFFRPYFVKMAVLPEEPLECHAYTTGGGQSWFSLFCTTLLDENRNPAKAVGAIRNIDRQKREQLRLLDKSRTDSMTGLLNKVTTEEEIRDALGAVHPDSLGVLMMIDIDNFKNVNDTMGHLAGDAVIIQLARQLLRSFRSEDIIGRVGGDEFHVFMRAGADITTVYEKAQGICSAVRKLFISSNLDAMVSISVGVAYTEQPIAYSELFRQADVALYRAKANGKNRYEIFGRASTEEGTSQMSTPPSLATSRTMRNSIVVDIIDTLFSTQDMYQGIDKTLDFIGNALHLGGILIYEKSVDFKSISISHEWVAQEAWSCKGRCQYAPVDAVNLPRPSVPGGIYYCSDIQSLPATEKKFSKDPSVTALVQCDIVRDGMIVGLISFEEHGPRRIWMQQEIDALILMSKLISGHISQKQSSLLLRQSNEATRDILNSLPGAFVCVVSRETHRLLYFNNRVKKLFPQLTLGKICHEEFMGCDKPCDHCPEEIFAKNAFNKGRSYCSLLHNSPFGKTTRLSISNILWENHEPAYVALISEHEITTEEQEQQKKKEAYVHALCNTYDYVLDVDCHTGQYEQVTLTEDPQDIFPLQGDYNTFHKKTADTCIAPEDHDAYLACFELQNMLTAFAAKASAVEMEFRRSDENGRFLWKNRTALPYPLDDGTAHILIYVRDITEQKEHELFKREEELNYLAALQSNYSEIFRIDLVSKKISALYYNSEQVPIPDGSIDFFQFISRRAKNRVFEDNLDEVLDFYSTEHVLKCVAKGETAELEYRKRQTAQGEYRWIVASLRPVPGNPRNALLLLRDVTRSREDEANFHAALKDSYTEIFEIDLDKNNIRSTFCKEHVLGALQLTGHYTHDIDLAAKYRVHPQDRSIFLQFYDGQNLRNLLKSGSKISLEYRLADTRESYKWISALVLPLPGSATCKILVLCQDISERKHMENATRRLEQRYNAIFRQSCDCVTEVNLITQQYCRTPFSQALFTSPQYKKYSTTFSTLLEYIHPDDRDTVCQSRSIESLRRIFDTGSEDGVCQYRICDHKITSKTENASYVWTESRAFFIAEDGAPTAFILSRNIVAQKRLEEERSRESQRFTLALRGTYTEIYDLNIDTNISTLLFNNSDRFLPVGVDTLMDTHVIIDTVVHPDDREHVRANIDGASLRARFKKGGSEFTEEFRRLGTDGAYHWISATIVPLREDNSMDCKAMVLVKDISSRKKQEQQERIVAQYTLALSKIYDELLECNVTRDVYHRIYHTENKQTTPTGSGVLSEDIPLIAGNVFHPDDQERFLQFFDIASTREDFAQGREYRVGEFRKFLIDDTFHWVSLTMFPVFSGKGSDEIYLVFTMDIDARKQAEKIAQQNILLERQRIADERYRIIVEQTHTLVFEWCNDQCYISPELTKLFAGAYDERDLMQIWQQDRVIHPEDRPLFETFLQNTRTRSHAEMTVRFLRRDGVFIWCKVVLSRIQDDKQQAHRYIGTLNDVNEATCSIMALQYRAEYDPLTGICNMQTFYTRAAQLMQQHQDRHYSIIRMDIDRFKVINDLYGMEEGDRLLKTIAKLFSRRMTPYSVCGHISGDIFCACVDYSNEQILNFVRETTETLAKYPLASRIMPSFGVCRVDNLETPINVLCDWANLALKTVKGNVFISHAFYDEQLRKRILDEKKIETEMHNSLIQKEFQLYLQPKVHMGTSRIVGSECLVRWMHPVEGMIPPDQFIPLFEKNGFIIRLDEYIWENTCIMLRDWLDRGLPPSPVSVNVSRMHIHDKRLCEKLVNLIKKYDLPPHLLELELTENVFLDSEKQLFDSIKELQRQGFIFSLDDFGAGYSSLNMLKSLPIKVIKIDRGFLNEVVTTERGKTIIRHTIALAKALNIQVVAEGVETAEHVIFLLDAGCFIAQGYYYSPPVPIHVFEAMAFEDKVLSPILPSR